LTEISRLQQFVVQHPWVRSVEINPLAITHDQVVVADIKLQV